MQTCGWRGGRSAWCSVMMVGAARHSEAGADYAYSCAPTPADSYPARCSRLTLRHGDAVSSHVTWTSTFRLQGSENRGRAAVLRVALRSCSLVETRARAGRQRTLCWRLTGDAGQKLGRPLLDGDTGGGRPPVPLVRRRTEALVDRRSRIDAGLERIYAAWPEPPGGRLESSQDDFTLRLVHGGADDTLSHPTRTPSAAASSWAGRTHGRCATTSLARCGCD